MDPVERVLDDAAGGSPDLRRSADDVSSGIHSPDAERRKVQRRGPLSGCAGRTLTGGPVASEPRLTNVFEVLVRRPAPMALDAGDDTGATPTRFHWVCPVCGKSSLIDAETRAEAREPLIRHLRYTDGDGHDAHDAIPDGMSIHEMDDYIDAAE